MASSILITGSARGIGRATAVERADDLPLRVPIGEPAERLLAARRDAANDTPFRMAPIAW